MNALYNHAVKQKTQLEQELAKFEQEAETSPISLQGSISATLVAFSKTLKQLEDQLARQRTIVQDGDTEAEAKFSARLATLQSNHKEFFSKFAELKQQYNSSHARTQLFGTAVTAGALPDDSVVSQRHVGQRDAGLPTQGVLPPKGGLPLYNGLQKEQSVFRRGNAQLDRILELGHQSLEDIMEQNQVLEKLQGQMTKSLRTLGLSESTIQNINKRVFKDKLIFYIGLAMLVGGIYFVLKLLR